MVPKEILSLTHPLVKHLVKLRKDKAYRRDQGQTLISGSKMIEDISSISSLITLITNKNHPLPDHIQAEQVITVSDEILKKITGLTNPEGVAAEVMIPKETPLDSKKYIIVLDQISDPGNLGTLLRTALALNVEGVFLIEGCVDPFNDKALSAAKGSTFKIPLFTGSYETFEKLISENKYTPYLGDIQGTSIEDAEFNSPLALILGNEAHGASNQLKKLSTLIKIPISSKIESLNVAIAGGILMYKIKTAL